MNPLQSPRQQRLLREFLPPRASRPHRRRSTHRTL